MPENQGPYAGYCEGALRLLTAVKLCNTKECALSMRQAYSQAKMNIILRDSLPVSTAELCIVILFEYVNFLWSIAAKRSLYVSFNIGC